MNHFDTSSEKNSIKKSNNIVTAQFHTDCFQQDVQQTGAQRNSKQNARKRLACT